MGSISIYLFVVNWLPILKPKLAIAADKFPWQTWLPCRCGDDLTNQQKTAIADNGFCDSCCSLTNQLLLMALNWWFCLDLPFFADGDQLYYTFCHYQHSLCDRRWQWSPGGHCTCFLLLKSAQCTQVLADCWSWLEWENWWSLVLCFDSIKGIASFCLYALF